MQMTAELQAARQTPRAEGRGCTWVHLTARPPRAAAVAPGFSSAALPGLSSHRRPARQKLAVGYKLTSLHKVHLTRHPHP